MPKEPAEIERDFHAAINMTAKELERWLQTDASRSVGQREGGESTGHRSGRRIVQILEKREAELTEADREHMRKVSGHVKRHLAQGPSKRRYLEESRWRHSLMNWGHDPLK